MQSVSWLSSFALVISSLLGPNPVPLFLHPHLYDAIWVQAEHYDVDFYLVAAIIRVESAWNPHAIGDYFRSYGLMQLNIDGAGHGHLPSRLLEVDYNLEVGVAYLRRCLDAYPDDLPRAIAAYNRGVAGAAPPFDPATNGYVVAVLESADHYRDTGVHRALDYWAREE